MHQCIKEDGRSLRGSLKRFLDRQSKMERRTEYCTRCGSVCMYLPTQIWLDGDEDTFSLGLPFCPHCNPELIARKPMIA